MNRNSSVGRIVSFCFYSLAIGVLVAGCGGGGGSNTPISGPSMEYIAEHQNGSFVGRWWLSGGASFVASADTYTAVENGTNQYAATIARTILSSGSWGPNPNPSTTYDLIPSGWIVSPDTATYLVTDGSHITITPTGEPGLVVTVTKTDLANTAISCTTPCFAPDNYPAGSTSYQLGFTYASNSFILYGDTISLPLIDDADNQMAALPVLDATTFCLPTYLSVLVPQGSGGVYNVFTTTSCSSGDISTAIASPTPVGTATIINQATGNSIVPNVLLVESTSNNIMSVISGLIIGVRDNVARLGWMTPEGSYQSDPQKNKTALNAELLANGLVEIP